MEGREHVNKLIIDYNKGYEESSSEGAGWGITIDGTFRKDIKKEVTFKLRLEDEVESHRKSPGKSMPDWEKSECKGPEAGKGWLC